MDSSFLLSLELLCLMNWLVKNEKTRLKILIKDAVKDGLGDELDTLASTQNLQTNEKLHESFVTFLVYLESELKDSLEKEGQYSILRENLASSLKTLNINLDSSTVLTSLKQVEQELLRDVEPKNESKTRKLLLKKMIKNWKPSKKDTIH